MVVDVVTKKCKKLFLCLNLRAAAVAPNVVGRRSKCGCRSNECLVHAPRESLPSLKLWWWWSVLSPTAQHARPCWQSGTARYHVARATRMQKNHNNGLVLTTQITCANWLVACFSKWKYLKIFKYIHVKNMPGSHNQRHVFLCENI